MILDQIAEVSKLEPEVFENQLDKLDNIEFWNSYIKYDDKHYEMDVAAFFEAFPVIICLCNDIISNRGT